MSDITPGDYDTPPIDLGGNWSFAWSPDSKEIAFERNTDASIATSTNNDIVVVSVTGVSAKRITENLGNDSQPLYSPDGKYLAYLQMKRAGFEADQKQLILYERATGKRTNLTENYDYSLNDVAWSQDSKFVYFNADDKGNESLFRLTVATQKIELIVGAGYPHSIRVLPDGKSIVAAREAINRPVELYRIDAETKHLTKLTSVNEERLGGIAMNPKEDFWFKGAGGTQIPGFLVKPPAFDASKK